MIINLAKLREQGYDVLVTRDKLEIFGTKPIPEGWHEMCQTIGLGMRAEAELYEHAANLQIFEAIRAQQ